MSPAGVIIDAETFSSRNAHPRHKVSYPVDKKKRIAVWQDALDVRI